jgi:hypothetical protein
LFAAIPFATTRSEARAGCGHILLEGVPGVAKTLTATTLAHAISARFQRIGDARLRCEDRDVPHRAGTHLHEHPAGG